MVNILTYEFLSFNSCHQYFIYQPTYVSSQLLFIPILILVVFQKALVEREIHEILQGHHVRKQESAKVTDVVIDGKEKLIAKNIDEDDVCPICQEELLDCKEPLTHCKYAQPHSSFLLLSLIFNLLPFFLVSYL